MSTCRFLIKTTSKKIISITIQDVMEFNISGLNIVIDLDRPCKISDFYQSAYNHISFLKFTIILTSIKKKCSTTKSISRTRV